MKKTVAFMATFFMLLCFQGCTKEKPAIISQCSLDGFVGASSLGDGNFEHYRTSKLQAGGWFADVAAGKVPDKVSLILVGSSGIAYSIQGSDQVGKSRVDVAQSFKNNSLIKSGFLIDIDLPKSLPNGVYSILINGNFERELGVCATNKTIKLLD